MYSTERVHMRIKDRTAPTVICQQINRHVDVDMKRENVQHNLEASCTVHCSNSLQFSCINNIKICLRWSLFSVLENLIHWFICCQDWLRINRFTLKKNYFLILSTFENHGNISSFTQNYPLPDVDFPWKELQRTFQGTSGGCFCWSQVKCSGNSWGHTRWCSCIWHHVPNWG